MDALSNRLRAIEGGARTEAGRLKAGLDAPSGGSADAGATEWSAMGDDGGDVERSPPDGGL